jgi:hypothetical protein
MGANHGAQTILGRSAARNLRWREPCTGDCPVCYMRSRAEFAFVLVLVGCNSILNNDEPELVPIDPDGALSGEAAPRDDADGDVARDGSTIDPMREASDDPTDGGAGSGSGGTGGERGTGGGGAGGRTDAAAGADVRDPPADSAGDARSDVGPRIDASGTLDGAFDAPADVEREACSPSPFTVFDATPAGTCGSVCNPFSALASDGAWTGLDCTGGGATLIDGVYVTACIGADFGSVANFDPVIVRAKSVANGCGTACSTECNTGDEMHVFYGSTRGSYQFAKTIALAPTFNDYPITLGLAARYVLVCRGGSGPGRDDVAVDSILSPAACR